MEMKAHSIPGCGELVEEFIDASLSEEVEDVMFRCKTKIVIFYQISATSREILSGELIFELRVTQRIHRCENRHIISKVLQHPFVRELCIFGNAIPPASSYLRQ